MSGVGNQNVREAMLTIRPHPASRIAGMHALHSRNADSRLMPMTRRNSSSVRSSHFVTG